MVETFRAGIWKCNSAVIKKRWVLIHGCRMQDAARRMHRCVK
jgi:hypothetical protein